jgi:thiamine-phosphate diphosphorylase
VKRLNLSICVITDSVPELGRTHLQVAAAAIRGGATMIQYRNKTVGDEEFDETALMLLAMTRAAGIPLIINDRVSIAIAVGADGVHIGREDGDADKVRRYLPEEMCLGVSATDYDEALAVSAIGADYLGVRPGLFHCQQD